MASLKPYHRKGRLEAGCDEAGRGCLAGPVTAAAVILPAKFHHPLLNDSKQLSEKSRDLLRIVIEEKALAWAVAFVSHTKIDEINILNASILAMHYALEQLTVMPDFILVDGNRFKPYREIEHACIVKGDAIYRSIAAASILAKTHRDDFMKKADEEFPSYNWKQNKGYPTLKHRAGISIHGPSPLHRMSFTLLPAQLELDLE